MIGGWKGDDREVKHLGTGLGKEEHKVVGNRKKKRVGLRAATSIPIALYYHLQILSVLLCLFY